MALRADRDGFLLGERVEIDTRWMARALEIWKEIKRDTGAMLAIMARRSGVAAPRGLETRSAEVRAHTVSVAEPVRREAPAASVARVVPIRPVELVPAAPRRPSPAASAAAAVRQRDEKGRFIAAAEPKRRTSQNPRGQQQEDDDSGSDGASALSRKVASAIADGILGGTGAAAQGVEQIDPVLGAAKELGDLASPLTGAAKGVGGGLFRSVMDRRERKKQRDQARETAKENIKVTIPWYRRILKALDEKTGGVGGGLLGGLGSVLAGGVGGGLLRALGIGGGAVAGVGLLSRVRAALGLGKAAAAVGAGVTGVATATGAARAAGAAANGGRLAALGRGALGAGKAALGKVMLPITAITSAFESYNTSTEEYARRLGWEEGESVAKDITARTVGVLSDFGNALTFGLADRLGNWVSGNGFVRSAPATTTPRANPAASGRPNPTAKSEPASAGNGTAGPASMEAIDAAIIKLESGGRDDAKAGSSSATGAGQFIDDTWLSMIRRHRPDLAHGKSAKELLALRTDGALSREMVSAYRKDNANYLMGRGLDANAQNLYAAHHFGPQGGAKFARAADGDLVDSFLTKGQIRANPYLRGMTKGQLTQNWAKRGLPVGAAEAPAVAGNAVSQPSAVPLASAARAGAATTPPAVSPRSMSGRTAAAGPSAAQLKVPPAPPQQVQIGSSSRGPTPVEVIVPQPLTQNVSDRGVANLATGGMGGGMGQRMGG